MSTLKSSNILSHISPYKLTIHSASDLQRLSLKRSKPISLEFRLEENLRINPNLSKKLTNFFSKKTLKLKNPPIKECLDNGNLTRHIRSLQVRPKEAATYITRITKRFSKVNKFAIVDEHDVFVPMRIKKKVHPMRMLRTFVYNHEFCKEFLRCARYASEVRIRRMSLDVNQLKRLQRLEKLHLILKTKYLNLPDEDTIFVRELGKTLLQLPLVSHVALEQEIDPETNPYTFLDLQKALENKAKVHLIADFVDVSSQRNKAFSVETILHTISNSGIENLNIKYVGVAQAMNRYGRSFYAPLHIKSDLYIRFLKTVMTAPFENVKFAPIVHSTYIDKELKDNLMTLMRPNKKLEIPRLSLVYNLDMAESNNIDLMRELYSQGAPQYEVAVINMSNIRRGLVEKLQDHYSAAFTKIEKSKAELTLQIVTKNLSTLENVIDIIAPKLEGMVIRSISVNIKEPVDKTSLVSLAELLKKSKICTMSKGFEIDFTQKEFPREEDLCGLLAGLTQDASQLNKMTLSYHNTRDCEETIKRACEKLRSQDRRTEFEYEINSEKKIYE